jgi:hypothetical protein
MKHYISFAIERNDIEQEVDVVLKYHKAFRGDRETPPESAEFEILSAKGEDGKEIEITESECERAIEIAFETADFETAEMDERY